MSLFWYIALELWSWGIWVTDSHWSAFIAMEIIKKIFWFMDHIDLFFPDLPYNDTSIENNENIVVVTDNEEEGK